MSLATPSCVQKLQTASHASLLNSEGVCLFREPDAGNLPVRFDEREQEIEPSQTGLRRALRKHPNSHREAKATAPVLDSTRDYLQNPQGLVLFVLCPTRLVSRFLGGCSASQNGHAKASSPVFTLRRSFRSTLCLRHFSSAMLVVYVLSKSLWISNCTTTAGSAFW